MHDAVVAERPVTKGGAVSGNVVGGSVVGTVGVVAVSQIGMLIYV
jgi:hypothetical protein